MDWRTDRTNPVTVEQNLFVGDSSSMPAMVYVTSSNCLMVGLIDRQVRKYDERMEHKGMGVCILVSLERVNLKRTDQ